VAGADGCFGGMALALRWRQQLRRLCPPLSHTVRRRTDPPMKSITESHVQEWISCES
jgi:hypothetical protein